MRFMTAYICCFMRIDIRKKLLNVNKIELQGFDLQFCQHTNYNTGIRKDSYECSWCFSVFFLLGCEIAATQAL